MHKGKGEYCNSIAIYKKMEEKSTEVRDIIFKDDILVTVVLITY